MQLKVAKEKLKEINKIISLQKKLPVSIKTFGINEEVLKRAIQSQK